MALPSKGTRSIVVDGVTYRWRVADKDSSSPGFIATRSDNPRCPLLWTRYDGDPDPITPSLVAAGIRAALREGWQPSTPAPPFRMLNGTRPAPPA
jgi:hypothetical protein